MTKGAVATGGSNVAEPKEGDEKIKNLFLEIRISYEGVVLWLGAAVLVVVLSVVGGYYFGFRGRKEECGEQAPQERRLEIVPIPEPPRVAPIPKGHATKSGEYAF